MIETYLSIFKKHVKDLTLILSEKNSNPYVTNDNKSKSKHNL